MDSQQLASSGANLAVDQLDAAYHNLDQLTTTFNSAHDADMLFPELGFSTTSESSASPSSSDGPHDHFMFDIHQQSLQSSPTAAPQSAAGMTMPPNHHQQHHQQQQHHVYQQSPDSSTSKTTTTSPTSSISSSTHLTESLSTVSTPLVGDVECQLLHKPRRAKGLWEAVVADDALRVTKGKGKWLRLEVRSRYPFDSNTMQLQLLYPKSAEANDDSLNPEGFVIESSRFQRLPRSELYFGELDLKLVRVARRLQFVVTILAPDHTPISVHGVAFSTHNNGKANPRANVSNDAPPSPDSHSFAPISSHSTANTAATAAAAAAVNHSTPHVTAAMAPNVQSTNAMVDSKQPNRKRRRKQSVADDTDEHDPSFEMPHAQASAQSTRNTRSTDAHHANEQATTLVSNTPTIVEAQPSTQPSTQPMAPVPHQQPPTTQPMYPQTLAQMQQQQQRQQAPIADHVNNVVAGSGATAMMMMPPNTAVAAAVAPTAPLYATPNTTAAGSSPNQMPMLGDVAPITVLPGSLTVEGTVRARAFFQFSDVRLKSEIEDLVDAVNIVRQLEGKTYRWRPGALGAPTADGDSVGSNGGRRVIGMIAQEVQRVLPEIVQEDANGILSVSYTELIPILIEAFKQQMKEYHADRDETRRHLDYLHKQLDLLSDRYNRLAATVPLIEASHKDLIKPFLGSKDLLMKPYLSKEEQAQIQKNARQQQMKRMALRTGVISMFLLGLCLVVYGALSIGTSISQVPFALSLTIMDASNLKPMDRDGTADVYVEASVNSQVFKTQTALNTVNPIWLKTFEVTDEVPIDQLSFLLWDQSSSSFAARRMGQASLSLDGIETDRQYEQSLELQSILAGDTVQGSLRIQYTYTVASSPTYQTVLLSFGVLLTTISLCWGFYVWRGEKFIALQQQMQQQQQQLHTQPYFGHSFFQSPYASKPTTA